MSNLPITYTGVVTEGKKRGRELGFPTANITLADDTLSGVYAGKVRFDGKDYMAAVFADQKRKLLESYILDFDADIYGKNIEVTLIEHVRERMVFTSETDLTDAIEQDVEAVREILRKSC